MSGTASDDSGISKVTVNGNVAELNGTSWFCTLSLASNNTHTITIVATDGAGNTNSATRYVYIEPYYQYVARISGTTVQSSLANTLTNSTVCAAIAGNSTACSIMKSYYSTNMTSYIDSNFNDGLNLLNYKCGLKCYLYMRGNQCSSITGGWTTWTNGGGGGIVPTIGSYQINFEIPSGDKNQYACGGAIAKTSINLSGYNTLIIVITNANNGGGWVAPGYTMCTGFRSSYSTSFDTGTSSFGVINITMSKDTLYTTETTLTGSISSMNSGYPVLGLTQGGSSNNYMYHRWFIVAISP